MNIYEFKEDKITLLYDENDREVKVYNFIIPPRLTKDFKITKEDILQYHSDPIYSKPIRGGINENKLKRIIKEYKKEKGVRNG